MPVFLKITTICVASIILGIMEIYKKSSESQFLQVSSLMGKMRPSHRIAPTQDETGYDDMFKSVL